jgi:hypothetical protein
MEKVWEIAKNEAKLCYGFIRRDVSMGMLPIPVFTTASLLYRNAPMEEIAVAIASASPNLPFCYLCADSFQKPCF